MKNKKEKFSVRALAADVKEKTFRFWQDGFSIDETRISALIVLLFIFVGFVIVMSVLKIQIPDIPAGVRDVITTLIWAVCGINVVSKVSNFFNPYNGNSVNTNSATYNTTTTTPVTTTPSTIDNSMDAVVNQNDNWVPPTNSSKEVV